MSGKFLNWWEWNSFSYSHICRRVCRGALCDLCICRREETWGRFHLVVFTQTLQFLSLFTVLPCWAIKLGAVQGKPLCSSSCIIWAGNSKANLSYGNSQVLFPLFYHVRRAHAKQLYTFFVFLHSRCSRKGGLGHGDVRKKDVKKK